MFTVLLFALLQASPSGIPADLAEELRGIEEEQTAIEATQKKLTAEKSWLEKKEYQIKDTEELLDRGINTLTTELAAFDNAVKAQLVEAANQRAAFTQVKAELENQQSRCVGEFEDLAYVNACNAELAALLARGRDATAWGERVNEQAKRLTDRSNALDKQKDTLEQINAQLYADQTELENRVDAYNEQIDKLNERIAKLSARTNTALARLAQTDAISADCAELAKTITPESCEGKGDPSDPANWNTPCEKAARCLSKAWDGAK